MAGVSVHGAIVLLCPVPLAEELCDAFDKHGLRHEECEALVMLPLPIQNRSQQEAAGNSSGQSFPQGQLLARCISCIPVSALEESLKCAANDRLFPYVPGAGVNSTLFRWMLENADLLDEVDRVFYERHGCHLALLSIVEHSALAYGYPNCDFVGAVGHGTFEEADGLPLQTALREVAEESRLVLPPDVATDRAWRVERLSDPGTFVDKVRRLTVKKQAPVIDVLDKADAGDDRSAGSGTSLEAQALSSHVDARILEAEIHVCAFQIPAGSSWRFDPLIPVRTEPDGTVSLRGGLVVEPPDVAGNSQARDVADAVAGIARLHMQSDQS